MFKLLLVINIYILISVAERQNAHRMNRPMCPPSDEINPCTCGSAYEVILSCSASIEDMVKALDYVSENSYEFKRVSLTNATTRELTPNLLRNTITESVLLRFVNLDWLDQSIFEGQTGNTLKSVEFKNFKLSDIPVNALKDLELRKLFFRHDRNLETLGTGYFDALNHADKLQYLFLNGNGIHTIGDGVFDSFTNLQTLSADDNKLTVISASLFPSVVLNGLHTLELGDNQITDFSWNIVCEMPGAGHRQLGLRNNQIQKIPEGALKKINTKSFTVDLRGNPIHCGCTLLTFILQRNTILANIFHAKYTSCFTPHNLKGIKLSELTAAHQRHCD